MMLWRIMAARVIGPKGRQRVDVTVVESLEDPPDDRGWGNTLDGAHLAFLL
jgi:hypothetical protein